MNDRRYQREKSYEKIIETIQGEMKNRSINDQKTLWMLRKTKQKKNVA